ncbi:MAG: thioredoxin domain-containing protein, partial [Chloroflexi bacterium]|nr:thioredoxin domain-containing protein [Chloroflexota bacterium]
ETLIVSPRDQFDNAIPCGGSAAAEALLRLGVLEGEERYTRTATRLLRAVAPLLARVPMGFGNWLKVVELYLAKPSEVAIIGELDADDTQALLRTLHARFQPNTIVIGMTSDDADPFASPLLKGRERIDGSATAYVCSGYQCDLPTSDPDTLGMQLDAMSAAT